LVEQDRGSLQQLDRVVGGRYRNKRKRRDDGEKEKGRPSPESFFHSRSPRRQKWRTGLPSRPTVLPPDAIRTAAEFPKPAAQQKHSHSRSPRPRGIGRAAS